MKLTINLALIFATIALLTACGNAQKTTEESQEGHDHTAQVTHSEKKAVHSEKAVIAVSLKDDRLNAVYQHYVHLTMALVNADIAEAKVAANAIELGAKELNNSAPLISLTSKISGAANIEAQRVAYAALSKDFIERVKASGLNSGELYVDYCPMAMNDKGASWLSNQKEVKNPYFGKAMMTCGEVKETIK